MSENCHILKIQLDDQLMIGVEYSHWHMLQRELLTIGRNLSRRFETSHKEIYA